MRPSQMDSEPSLPNTNQGKKRGLSKSAMDELERESAKRQKVAER